VLKTRPESSKGTSITEELRTAHVLQHTNESQNAPGKRSYTTEKTQICHIMVRVCLVRARDEVRTSTAVTLGLDQILGQIISTVSVSFEHRTTSCFYRLHCTAFYPKLLFIVCCTAYSIHICLFTRGAISPESESAPLPENEDKMKIYNDNLLGLIVHHCSIYFRIMLVFCMSCV